MPLLDHFHRPLVDEISWTTLHAGWATRIADDLNDRWLPKEFIAAEIATSGLHPEIDIATYEKPTIPRAEPRNGPAVATLTHATWQVSEPTATFAAASPE